MHANRGPGSVHESAGRSLAIVRKVLAVPARRSARTRVMKLARGLVVATVIAACVPLAAACGSAPDPNQFSRAGSGSGDAGASSAHAGSSAAGGKVGTAGSSNGSGGHTNGDAGEGNGSSGAPNGGASSGDAGESGAAGETGAGAPNGGTAGASVGGAGTSGTSLGGAGGGGIAAGGASLGGAGAGGTAPAGGAGTGGTATGGSSVGGAGTGGTAAGGASLGGAGAGGTGGANGCPALPPTDKADCNVSTPSSCFYSGVACSCLAAAGPGPIGAHKWACYGTPEKCPSAKPTAGNSCAQNLGAECPYPNQDYCICKGNSQDAAWACQAPTVTCLANKPPQKLACGPVRACQYSDVSCFCNASSWSCLGG